MALLNAVTSTGASAAVDLGVPRRKFQFTVATTGNPTSVVCNLEAASNLAGGNPDTGTGALQYNWSPIASVVLPGITGTVGQGAYPFTTSGGSGTNSATVISTTVPARFIRANLTTLSGGSSPTVTAGVTVMGNDLNEVT